MRESEINNGGDKNDVHKNFSWRFETQNLKQDEIWKNYFNAEAIRLKESLEDEDSSLVAWEITSHVVKRTIVTNFASSSTPTTHDVELQHELKSIMETLADLKISVVQSREKKNQNVLGDSREYRNYTPRVNFSLVNFAISRFTWRSFHF